MGIISHAIGRPLKRDFWSRPFNEKIIFLTFFNIFKPTIKIKSYFKLFTTLYFNHWKLLQNGLSNLTFLACPGPTPLLLQFLSFSPIFKWMRDTWLNKNPKVSKKPCLYLSQFPPFGNLSSLSHHHPSSWANQ